MYFASYNLGYILVYFVRWRLCILDNNSSDTVISNSWDDLEAFHADPRSLSSEESDDMDKSQNVVVIDEDTSYSEIEIPESSELNHGSSQLNRGSNLSERKRKWAYNKKDNYGKFVALDIKFRGTRKIVTTFNELKPGISNPYNYTKKQQEMIFLQLGEAHRWKELSKYQLNEYSGYWGHACDYFWKKEDPLDERYRGCLVSTLLFPKSRAQVRYIYRRTNSTRVELLRCKCYYYSHDHKIMESKPDEFGVHKYVDNEYFILEKLLETTANYIIVDYLTEAHLPIPIK